MILRQRFKHHDWLISTRYDGFGDGDEFFLLAENTQAGRLWFTAVELRRRARRRVDAARLKLRDRNVELRTVAHALFNYW